MIGKQPLVSRFLKCDYCPKYVAKKVDNLRQLQ